MRWEHVRKPVRAADSGELNQLARARGAGTFVAWRDEDGRLHTHVLTPLTPATIGRAEGETIRTDHPQVSREHAEVTVRVYGMPVSTSVYLLDFSKHGTEHRRVTLNTSGAAEHTGGWQTTPQFPSRAWQFDEGAHDVRLAREHCLLIDGVPVDDGATADRDHEDPVPQPTVKQRLVLVELCRPFFGGPDAAVAAPTNAQIAVRIGMNEERVRGLTRELYKRYGLNGSRNPRVELVNVARKHTLVDASDFL